MQKEMFNNLKSNYICDLNKLNKQQKEVFSFKGNCVVLAGPGSGKTRVLTLKIAKILQEEVFFPRKIACITYSNECVREIENRLNKYGINISSLYIGTVHSFCFSQIIKPFINFFESKELLEYSIIDYEEKNSLFKAIIKEINYDEQKFHIKDMDVFRRAYFDKNGTEYINSPLKPLVEAYEKILSKKRFLDFDEIIIKSLNIIKSSLQIKKILKAKFPVLIIDEYQDLGILLHEIIKELCIKENIKLMAFGDPNQSIYGFNGAEPELLNSLANKKNIECKRLKINYRCKKKINDAALNIFNSNSIVPKDKKEGLIKFHKIEGGLKNQAKKICEEYIPNILNKNNNLNLGNIAVLYLDRNDGDIIAKVADSSSKKYIRFDQNSPYPKTLLTRWIEDCATWCVFGLKEGISPSLTSLIKNYISFWQYNSNSNIDMNEKKNVLIKFLWENCKKEILLKKWLVHLENKCLSELLNDKFKNRDFLNSFDKLKNSCRQKKGQYEKYLLKEFAELRGSPTHLNLSTFHQSKGREFEIVFLMGMEEGRIPSYRFKNSNELHEERRKFYVALTRAISEVHITFSGFYTNKSGKKFVKGASRFINELMRKH